MAEKGRLTTSDHFSYEEYENLLERLHKDKRYIWEMYARLSFCTACRASDVLHFRWQDVIGKSYIVVTEQKTGKTRQIPVNPSVQSKFFQLYDLMMRPDKEDYIFTNERRAEKPFTIQYVNQKLKLFKSLYRLKIRNFSTHTFRKTFGRYVYDTHNHSAESLMLLNRILCHANIATTKAYIGITQDEIQDVFNSIKF